MPRERIELFRVSNSKPKEKIFILAYEGNKTETKYFEALKETIRFNNEQIHLVSLKRPRRDTASAPIHVFNKLKREAKDVYNFEDTDEFWMIIDRDQWINLHEINTLCKNEGNFYLALSNPCFEFWLLLHIKDTSDFSEEELIKIFENKKVNTTRTYLKKLLGILLEDGYNESNLKPKRFFPNIDIAIVRARFLDNPAEDFPTQLGSHVYKLVEKIII
ncbi:MAG TPA: RloB family protein [Bacteroidales bacterium]|nr:RloB family protein [Bacteroidales bacterium]